MYTRTLPGLAGIALFLLAGASAAEERYLQATLATLEVTEGVLPGAEQLARPWYLYTGSTGSLLSYPYAVGEDGAEIYLLLPDAFDEFAVDAAGKQAGNQAVERPWLGECMALRVNDGAMAVLETLVESPLHTVLQARAWGNIPVLNEWKRRYPDQDPLAVHERYWGARLVCPGGGEYVWNEAFQTMESTVYGCPAAPKTPKGLPEVWERLICGDFGVTFEGDGLRAQACITRER